VKRFKILFHLVIVVAVEEQAIASDIVIGVVASVEG